eukprot:7780348-Karenia_brevis.AAC.1
MACACGAWVDWCLTGGCSGAGAVLSGWVFFDPGSLGGPLRMADADLRSLAPGVAGVDGSRA